MIEEYILIVFDCSAYIYKIILQLNIYLVSLDACMHSKITALKSSIRLLIVISFILFDIDGNYIHERVIVMYAI